MRGQRFFPLLVVAAALLAYHNSFTGAFLHDDVGSILENPTIRHLWPIWQPLSPPHRHGLTVEGRPLINFSLAINYALGGYDVRGYHALNLTVHILAGLTLLGIVRRTLLAPTLVSGFGGVANELALATAVLWTVHPLQTESVTYVIQRAESIMGLFYLLTLYCFIRGAGSQTPRIWYGLSVLACASGMTCKEVMVSAPVMVLLYDRAFVVGSFREAWRRRWLLYLALGGTWILLGCVMIPGQLAASLTIAKRIDRTWWQYLATEPGVILHYLWLSVWPHPLGFDFYGWSVANTWMRIGPATIVVVALLGASVWAWRRNPAWGFVGAGFFLILAPSSSFVPLHQLLYEHRMYLSLAAVVILVVLELYSLMGRHSLVVFVVAAIGLGVLTWRRNQDYRSDLTMSLDAVTKFPDDARAHARLASALGHAGRLSEAIAQYEQALRLNPDMADVRFGWGLVLGQAGRLQEAIAQYEQALRLKPDFAIAHNNLGLALAKLGDVQQAIEHYEQALRIDPDLAETHNNLGNALVQVGKTEDAIRHYEHALRIDPRYVEAHNNLGSALLRVGRIRDAIAHCEQALKLNRNDAQAHNNLGNALSEAGDVNGAIWHYEQAARIDPELAEVHYNLGNALFQAGKMEDATRQYAETLRIDPHHAEAQNNWGTVLLRTGKFQEAIDHYEKALIINPDYAEAHNNLAIALSQLGRTREAIMHWEQALRLKPDFAEARDSLERARAVQ